MPFIKVLLSTFSGIEDVSARVVDSAGNESFPYTTAGIATVHTVFNVVNVLLFMPLLPYLSRFLQQRVKDKVRPEKRYLTKLDFQLFDSPFAAMEQGRAELIKMRDSTREMLSDLEGFLSDVDRAEQLSRDIFKREETLDVVQKEITVFLTDALSGQLSHDMTEEAKQAIRASDEYESVSDYITQVLKLHLRLRAASLDFTAAQHQELSELHNRVGEFFDLACGDEPDDGNFETILERVKEEGQKINGYVRTLRSTHWTRMSRETLPPLVTTTYSDALHSYRKIKDHLLNVAEVRAGEK